MLARAHCECPRETCFQQFRGDRGDIIVLVQEYAALPKAAQDSLVGRSGGSLECFIAGRQMGIRCFARMLGMHHGNVYRKGARIDRRQRQLMLPR